MVEFLFLDLDDTILDFHKAEGIALRKTLETMGLSPTPEVLSQYREINRAHWEMLERREITREQVLVRRFGVLFERFGIQVDQIACARLYEEYLSQGHYFLDGAVETLEILVKKYRLFLASNGTAKVQIGRLDSAKINHFFEKMFISELVGPDKPSVEFFDRCFAQIPGFQVEKAMIVGDSLTSDIQGGINAGMRTCWVNPKHAPVRTDIQPDYQIESIVQLPALLESL